MALKPVDDDEGDNRSYDGLSRADIFRRWSSQLRDIRYTPLRDRCVRKVMAVEYPVHALDPYGVLCDILGLPFERLSIRGEIVRGYFDIGLHDPFPTYEMLPSRLHRLVVPLGSNAVRINALTLPSALVHTIKQETELTGSIEGHTLSGLFDLGLTFGSAARLVELDFGNVP